MCIIVQDNIDLIKSKTSKAKKTITGLINYLNKRISIEQDYSN